MPGDYLSSTELRQPNTSRSTENEKLLNEKYVRQKQDVTKTSDQSRRNEKKFWGSTNYEILSATMVGRLRKFFVSNRLKQLEKLNICRRQVM